ncbi:MAG: hypothetical protein RI947_1530 [Candidatus Parcubacteria bacterium]|jgi:cellulose synthase (UDP-forming)
MTYKNSIMQHRIKTKKIHNTALLFIIIAPITILYYASYVFDPVHMGNPYLYFLQIFADAIAITIVGTLWVTILLDMIQPEYHKRELKYDKKWLEKSKVKVDILIPVAREPIDIIELTVRNALAIDYPHTTYILDDGDSDDVKRLAHELKVIYVARPPHAKSFAKSGNLNYGLKQCKGEYFAVFDADHAPKKEFLTELLPFFENTNVALVQSPQHYTNTDNFIASGTAQAQEIFYKYVQPAKNSYNAAFCVGTNMVYRRSSIDDIGGIAMRDHSEDIWTTILIHEKGYESVFYNKVLAEGRAPESIPSFFRQQNRWARGGFTLFFTHNPLFIRSLSIDQRLQYFFSNIHYFSAFAVLIYLLLPLMYLLFNLHPMDVKHNNGWLAHYLPYFITVYFLPWFLLGTLKLSTISTSIASFAPYLQAFISVFLKNKYQWVATESKKVSFNVIMLQIWPHVFFIVLSLLAIAVGWYNPEDVMTTMVTSFWVLMNSYFLFSFVKNGLIQT